MLCHLSGTKTNQECGSKSSAKNRNSPSHFYGAVVASFSWWKKESIWIINALTSCRVLFRKKCISPITTPATALSSQWYRSHTALKNLIVKFFQPLLTNHANKQHRGCVICYPMFISVWQERSISNNNRLFNGNYCCKKFCWKASLTISRLFSPKLRSTAEKTDSLTGAYF